MSAISESAIETKVVRHCKARGYYCRKLGMSGARGYSGMPDRLICYQGKVFFLELKRKGKKPTPLQEREIRLLGEAGMQAGWADSYELAVQILDDFFAGDVM